MRNCISKEKTCVAWGKVVQPFAYTVQKDFTQLLVFSMQHEISIVHSLRDFSHVYGSRILVV